MNVAAIRRLSYSRVIVTPAEFYLAIFALPVDTYLIVFDLNDVPRSRAQVNI